MDRRDHARAENLADCMRVGDVNCSRSILSNVIQDRDALDIIRTANGYAGPRSRENVAVDMNNGQVFLNDRNRGQQFYVGQLQMEPVAQPYYDGRDPNYRTPPYIPDSQPRDATGALLTGVALMLFLASRNGNHGNHHNGHNHGHQDRHRHDGRRR